MNIDYYAVLGVLPNAEDIVIRAAYRALVQRYHPDRIQGNPADSARRIVELNAAYAVLSDPVRRSDYDASRGTGTQDAETTFDANDSDAQATYDPLEADWQVAVKYYPDLSGLSAELAKLSWRLANSFRAQMLESKNFAQRADIAERMQRSFLETYFGTDPLITRFAHGLILGKMKTAALALNKAVRVLGEIQDPHAVIRRIEMEELGKELSKYRIVSTVAGTYLWRGTLYMSAALAIKDAGEWSKFAEMALGYNISPTGFGQWSVKGLYFDSLPVAINYAERYPKSRIGPYVLPILVVILLIWVLALWLRS